MSSFLKFRLAALFVFAFISASTFSEASPILPIPVPPTDGTLAVASPILPIPVPPTDGTLAAA